MTTYHLEVKVSTGGLQSKYLIELQRLIDILTFSLAGAELVDEARYRDFYRFWSVAPAPEHSRTFKELAELAEFWFAKHCLQDAIDIMQAFIEECHLVCDLYHLVSLESPKGEDYNRVMGSNKASFHARGLPSKISHLKERFGVETDWDVHLRSLNRARNCMVHRLGVVSEKDVDEGGELAIVWKETRVTLVSPDGKETKEITGPESVEGGWNVQLEMLTNKKAFKLGDRIELSYNDLTNALLSLMHFVIELPKSIDRYGEKLGVSKPKPASDA